MIGGSPPVLRGIHESQAAIHRQAQARQLASAALYRRHACALSGRISRQSDLGEEDPPRFIDTLLAVTRSASVCLGLGSSRGADVVVASDQTALAAHDCEAVLGEGPVHALQLEGPLLVASDDEMRTRWTLYAAAVEPLGVEAVATVPLRVNDLTFGSLTAFGTSAQPIEPGLQDLCAIGDAVVDVLVAEWDNLPEDTMGLIGSADHRDTLHQAAGIVSVQYGCQIADALALLHAHAFAAESDLSSVTQAVVAGELRFERQ